MEVLVLDDKFESLLLIDAFESLIWTERYDECGDFEIYTNANQDLIEQIQQGYYLKLAGSEDLMIIESIQVESEFDKGTHLTISGRSATSILDRRIIWRQTVLSPTEDLVIGGLQRGIKKLLDENIIDPGAVDPNDPDLVDRTIPNFIFEPSTDPEIVALSIRAQYTGDNLYETIETICKAYGLGFRVYLNDANQFVFKLYVGKDRSYGQDDYPLVIFSPKYDNISQTSYLESDKTLKNVTLVAGEGEGINRRTLRIGDASGLDRRELYTDARDIQSEVYDDQGQSETLPDAEYNELLFQRGLEKLAENQATRAFDGSVEATPGNGFEYGTDFSQGDILQVENEFGLQAKVRVTEFIRSQDTSGIKMTPTFSVIDSGMNASSRRYYTKLLHALTVYGIMDDDFNGDVEKLTVKDISKLENHAILDEQYEGLLNCYGIPAMLDALEEHIILDDDYPEEED